MVLTRIPDGFLDFSHSEIYNPTLACSEDDNAGVVEFNLFSIDTHPNLWKKYIEKNNIF